MRTRVFCLLLLVGLAAPAAGDETKAASRLLQEEHLSSAITNVVVENGVPVAVEISRGSDHGIVAGSRGEILGREPDGGVRVIGRAEIVTVGPRSARARLLREAASELAAIPDASALQVRALLPRDAWRKGAIRKSVLNGIVFLDNAKKPLYDDATILRATGPADEDAALARMVEAGIEVVEFTVDFPQVISHGKWKGKRPAEILAGSTPDDYRDFLRFVDSFPSKYLGRTWKISETYATWIISDMPLATGDRMLELAALPASELTAAARALAPKDAVYLFEYVRRQIGDRDDDLATSKTRLALLERILAARSAPADPLLVAQVEHARADLLWATPGKTLEAAAAFGKCATAHFKVDPRTPEGLALDASLEGIVCLNNEANALKLAGKHDDVLLRVKAIREAIPRELARAPNAEIAAHLPLSEAYAVGLEAQILQERGDYRRVIEELSPLVERYAATGAPGAREKEIDLLAAIAKAHRKLGEVDLATKLYERMSLRAGELGDVGRQATLSWDIGDLLFDSAHYEPAIAEYDRTLTLARRGADEALAARAISMQAQSLWSLGRTQEAVARHGRALVIRESLADESGIAWQLVQMAKIHREMGEHASALASFERALALQKKLKDKSPEAETQLELGAAYLLLSRLDEAEKAYAAARTLYAGLKRVPDQASAAIGEARAAAARGKIPAAIQSLDAVIAAGDKTGDFDLRIWGRIWKSRMLRESGRGVEARAVISQALSAAGKESAHRIDVLVEHANVELNAGRLEEADALSREASRLADEAKDAGRRRNALAIAAGIEFARGRYTEALALHEQVGTIARETSSRPALVDALQQKAWVLLRLGRLAEARAALDEALPAAIANGDPVARAWVHNNLADLASSHGDIEQEIAQKEIALELLRKHGDDWGVAALLYNRSIVKIRLRDFAGAAADTLEASKKLGKREDAQLRTLLDAARGAALGEQQKYTEADAALAQALTVARKSVPQSVPYLLSTRGRFLAEKGDFAKALPLLEESVKIEESRSASQYGALASLGDAQQRAGNLPAAEKNLREALRRCEAIGGSIPWRLLFALAKVESSTKRPEDALDHLRLAVKDIERGEAVLKEGLQRESYWENKQEVYSLLVKLLLEKGEVEHALRYVDRAKTAELREVQRRAGDSTDLELELQISEKSFEKELTTESERPEAERDAGKIVRLQTLLVDVRRRRAEFIDKLDRDLKKEKGEDVYMMSPLALEKLQQSLPPGQLVISPFLLENEAVVFAFTRDTLTAFRTPIRAVEVERLVAEVLKEAVPSGTARRGSIPLVKVARADSADALARSFERLMGPSKRLYDALLRQPLERFGAPETLVVSASGTLRYLPFAALFDGKQWLVEKTHLVEITALDQQKFGASGRDATTGARTVLAFSDPDGSLPGARDEVVKMKGIFPAATVFDGEKATLDALHHNIQFPGYDVLHLATHGRLDSAAPERSHILLAGKSLYYKEIPSLRFKRTGLVVLSACDTASRGSGVEVTGIAFQFSRTNVRSIVATLWPVDDAATATLMTSFYGRLSKGESYAAALAGAQRELAADPGFRHPFYWAPFVLIGSPD